MTLDHLTLMNAMLRKMDWQEERQKVLAQNIANADTPGYQPMDISPLGFKDLMRSSSSSIPLQGTSTSTTDGNHISASITSISSHKIEEKKQKNTYEVAPAGNSVILEEQLIKMNETMTEHRMTANLYQKYMDMIKMSTRSQ